MFTGLLQVVAHKIYSGDNGVGDLPACPDLVVGSRNHQEHAVTGLVFSIVELGGYILYCSL